ncbi:MAG: gliding motility protein GldL [Bacteroidia bacterium]|nr:gliding motility protein GldL [Bacteroidia bacterium]
MSKKTKGKLDAITFIYGFGAAVVLVGAMFKFLGWSYANEMFVAGLSIEAVVFLISAFERSTEDKEYNWENVFPQLTSAKVDIESNDTAYPDAMTQFSNTLTDLTAQLKEMSSSIQHIKVEMQVNATKSTEMHSRISEFNEQMDTYNNNMRKINSKYNAFLNSGI